MNVNAWSMKYLCWMHMIKLDIAMMNFYWFVRFAWVKNIMHELVIVWDIPCFEYFPLSVIRLARVFIRVGIDRDR